MHYKPHAKTGENKSIWCFDVNQRKVCAIIALKLTNFMSTRCKPRVRVVFPVIFLAAIAFAPAPAQALQIPLKQPNEIQLIAIDQ
jgi:hypothetical protein